MFQLSEEEGDSLRSQIATSNALTSQTAMSKPGGRGGRRTLPYAFTEHGVSMLSSVLNSERAVQMNIIIIRAFVRMRELLASHKSLADKIEKLEQTQTRQGSILGAVVQDIQKLKNPPVTRAIGFRIPSPKKK